MLFMLVSLIVISSFFPYSLADPENFTPAIPLVTPIPIQSKWYFLFAYAILRSIPNKLGGVIALMMSILILMILPFSQTSKLKSIVHYPYSNFILSLVLILTWIGA